MRNIAAILAVALLMPAALAQTARTYTYDALGRLVKVTPGTGTPVCYTHDAADNRSLVAAAANCTAPTGGAGGGGGGGQNYPPEAQDDFLYFQSFSPTWSGALGVLLNDTDQNLPNDVLTVTSVTGSPYATIQAGGSDVYFSGSAGSYTLNYTIKDAQNATDSGTIYLTIVYCNPVCELEP